MQYLYSSNRVDGCTHVLGPSYSEPSANVPFRPLSQKKGGLFVSATEKFRVDSCSTTKRVRIIELLGTKRAVELCPPGLSDMWGISFKAPLGVSCIDTKRFKRKITPFWKPGWYGKNDAQQWQSLNCCSYLWPQCFQNTWETMMEGHVCLMFPSTF